MSGRHLIVLGTASQAPTRYRQHNSYALRWDEQLIFFDPGEGTQRQAIFADVAIARATAVCITHFHGDHSLGLAGLIQRRALDARSASKNLGPLPVVHPADGLTYFERLRSSTIFHDTSQAYSIGVESNGDVMNLGPTATLSARQLDHRVTTFGYRIDEPDGRRLVPETLKAKGIVGPDVGRLIAAGRFETPQGTVGLDEVSTIKRGQSMAFVMDTAMCDAALELADGVDLLVCESTYLETERELAAKYFHLTALQAGEIARDAGARRLVLTHFSARYPNNEAFADEARQAHDDVVAATDLAVIDVPDRL